MGRLGEEEAETAMVEAAYMTLRITPLLSMLQLEMMAPMKREEALEEEAQVQVKRR